MANITATPITRKAALIAAASSTAALLAGCDSQSQSKDSAGQVEDDGLLRISIDAPLSLDPHQAADEASVVAVSQLFDPLMAFDYESGELTGRAALLYKMSDDAKTFTFTLRHGAFHNGDTVEAADFKRAWERIVSPKSAASTELGASPVAYLLSLVAGYDELAAGSATGLSGVEAADAKTLKVTLAQPFAEFATVLTHPALSPVPADAEKDVAAFAKQPQGNGAFKLTGAWKAGESIDLALHEERAGTSAFVDGCHLVVRKSVSDAYKDFQAKKLDVVSVPAGQAADVLGDNNAAGDGMTLASDARVAMGADLTTYMLSFNCRREPLDSAGVRRALSQAIDREGLCEELYHDLRVAATGVIAPALAPSDEAWPYTALDAAAAREGLETAWPIDSGDTRALTVFYDEEGSAEDVLKYLKKAFAKVDVTLELKGLSWKKLKSRLSAGEYDMAYMAWTPDYPSADAVLYPLFLSENGQNVSGYAADDVDAALAEARSTVDTEARVQAYAKVDALVAEACPVAPISHGSITALAGEAVVSLTVDPAHVPHLDQAETNL